MNYLHAKTFRASLSSVLDRLVGGPLQQNRSAYNNTDQLLRHHDHPHHLLTFYRGFDFLITERSGFHMIVRDFRRHE